ncbi:hypothetical protein BC834DRAFT_967193 [Gloeopeniophorella convolvens]|nr:hypothetical protein BC834DRAFT_967193 [Gloeopeniophorella convolvens]
MYLTPGTEPQDTGTTSRSWRDKLIPSGFRGRRDRAASVTSTPSQTASVSDTDLTREVREMPGVKGEATISVFETTIAVLKEAAEIAQNIPYIKAVSGVILHIVKIKSEVDMYRDVWEETMYNVHKLAVLLRDFGKSCERHGLLKDDMFPQPFIQYFKDLKTEFDKLFEVLSQCRGKTRFEQFKKGLSRVDMTKDIRRCDGQMQWMLKRFDSAVLFDIRISQYIAEQRMNGSSTVPSITVNGDGGRDQPPYTGPPRLEMPIPVHFPEPQLDTLSLPKGMHTRSKSAGSNPISTSPIGTNSGPTKPQVFFGRDEQLEAIVQKIVSPEEDRPARIAILGSGGVGKTALAHAVLTHEQIKKRFPRTRYLIPCESLKSRDALVVALANTLALLQPGTTSDDYPAALDHRVLSALSSEECIVCLDDFEATWDQETPTRLAVEHFLRSITELPSVIVIITMRGDERPQGTRWTQPKLSLGNFSREAAKSTWEALAGSCDQWAEHLIDAVECLPLAVTLLGSLAEVSTSEMLWERWQSEKFGVVESLERSFVLSLDSSRMTDDPSSRRLLGLLSLLPDGITALPSPEFRRAFPDIPNIPRSLDTLLKCSLAVRTSDRRVQVNSLVQHYCEKYELSDPKDAAALRNYYVALASHGYDNLSDDLFKHMTMEINNMESVLQKALTWTPPERITPVIEAIIAYTQFCSYIGNFSDRVITLATKVQGLSNETLGDCLTSLGSVCLSDDRVEDAKKHFEKALGHHAGAKDVIGQANDYCHLGDIFYRDDKMEEAQEQYRLAYNLNLNSQSTYGQANALTHLGDTYRKLGDLSEAHQCYAQSLKFHEDHSDQLGQANSLKGLGHVALRMDDMKKARGHFERALRLHQIVNDLVGQANDISSLAEIHQRLDNFGDAEGAYEDALKLHEKAKDDLGRGNTLSHLGDLYRKRNKLAEAENCYNKAIAAHRKALDKLGQANDLKGLGGIYHRQGDTQKAKAKYEDALVLYEDSQNSLGKANCQRFLGRMFYTERNLDKAEQMFQDAYENYRKANESVGQGNTLGDRGDVERRRGNLLRAQELYKEALEAHGRAADKVGQGNDYKGLGVVYEKLGKLKEAKQMVEKAKELHGQSGTVKSERQDQELLQKIAQKMERAKSRRK